MELDTNTTITPSDCASLHNVPCRHDHEPFIAKHVFSASRPQTASPTTAPMTDHSPPRLELPYADLHAPAHREPHIDSEEAVQYERRRVSRELHPIYPSDSSRQSVEEPHASQSNASLRSRNASLYTASTADERLWSRALGLDDADAAPDTSEGAARSTRSSVRVPQWHDLFTKFWSTHISITIDEGAHRDHLGTLHVYLLGNHNF
jgi:hypothetical protein